MLSTVGVCIVEAIDGAGGNDLMDLNPANFEEASNAFKAKTGTAAGPTVRLVGRIENAILAVMLLAKLTCI